ncbi:endolytic transglycosylase MltG [Umezawaea beigongshangensis]|uniref:endolytic transglycosylase MltG n=1 Tax=Umezawaea beigongshangensis TaxID=2780383 RepID=UPI0018F16067|nr:endolytic transglycosylase MltG [Umezawaea beigongshangensis]
MTDDLGLFADTDARADEERPRSGKAKAAAAARARRAKQKRKMTVLWVVAAVIVGVGGFGAYYGYQTLAGIGDYADFPGPGETEVIVEVKDGDLVTSIGETLKENGVVASARAFVEAGADDARVTGIQPGFYLMKTKMSGTEAVTQMVAEGTRVPALDIKGGDILHDITLPGGQVRKGIFSMLSDASCTGDGEAKTCVPVDEIRDQAENADPTALGVPDWALPDVQRAPKEHRLEGLIVRAAYQVKPGASAVDLLRGLITASAVKLQSYGFPSGTNGTGFSPYQVLIIASLIEKEGIEKDFGRIGRVIYNRLAEPQVLGLDSTVNYQLEKPELTTSDSDRENDSPYNTYVVRGLTPTPIGTPSDKAIEAAVKPPPGPEMYFVKCQKDGTSCFNVDFEAHDAASAKAQAEGVF